jgi:CDGSH iron-sulfur domain-containing protein 3
VTVLRFPDVSAVESTGQPATCGKCWRATQVANVPMCGAVSLRAPERALVPGQRYLWCSCGQSTTDVLCDGTSCTAGFKALPFEVTVEQAHWSLCACRYTRQPPLCDGFHAVMDPNPTKPPCDCAQQEQEQVKE